MQPAKSSELSEVRFNVPTDKF